MLWACPWMGAYRLVELYDPHTVQRIVRLWTWPSSARSKMAPQWLQAHSIVQSAALRTGGALTTAPMAGVKPGQHPATWLCVPCTWRFPAPSPRLTRTRALSPSR